MHKRPNLQNILLIVTVFVLLLVGYFRPITAMTQDLGRHIRTGELILKTHEVPKTNLYSYTYPDFPFINHHFLSEVTFYLVYKAVGLKGLLFMTTTLILIACTIIYETARKKASVLVCVLSCILYIGILFERTDLRPELLSFLFTAIFISLLFRYKDQYTNLVFLLIPLELLWVNTHIYFPIGILLIVLFLIDLLIEKRGNFLDKKIKILILVLLGSSIAIFLNPNGIQGALYPLRVFQNYGYTIEENQTPFFLQSLNFQKPSFLYLKIAIVLLFISLFASMKKTKPIDWLLSAVFTFIALSAVRNFPLFAITTFIPFAIYLKLLTEKLLKIIPNAYKKPLSIGITLLLCILIVFQIHATISKKGFGATESSGAKNALDFYKTESLKGPIFNNFDIGSYLIFRLYPKERVFVDGRPEAYPKEFFQDVYIPMQQDKMIFDKLDAKYHFNTIVFAHTDQTPWARQFFKNITTDANWKIIYLDSAMLILTKNTPQNKLLIEKFAMEKNTLKIANLNDASPLESFMQLAYLFNTIGWTDQEIQMYNHILKIDPQNCSVLYNLAVIYTNQKNPTASVYANKYQAACNK